MIEIAITAAERILRTLGRKERHGPLRAENLQGLQIDFGKLLLVYFMRLPRP